MNSNDLDTFDDQSLYNYAVTQFLDLLNGVEILSREDLQELVLSLVLSQERNVFVFHEIVSVFYWIKDDVDIKDLLFSLLESTSFILSSDLLKQIVELTENRGIVIKNMIIFEICDTTCKSLFDFTEAGSSVVVVHVESKFRTESDPQYNSKITFHNRNKRITSLGISIIPAVAFGVNDWLINLEKCLGISELIDVDSPSFQGSFFATSHTYQLNEYCNNIMDYFIWGWGTTTKWTDSLENSIVELLVSIDEDLIQILLQWQSMMSMSGLTEELLKLIDIIKSDVSNALLTHNAYAIGRLHQTISQLFQSTGADHDENNMSSDRNHSNSFQNMFSSFGSSMGMQLPKVFKISAKNFIRAKLEATPLGPLFEDIRHLLRVIPEYIRDVSQQPVCQSEISRLSSFLSTFQDLLLIGSNTAPLTPTIPAPPPPGDTVVESDRGGCGEGREEAGTLTDKQMAAMQLLYPPVQETLFSGQDLLTTSKRSIDMIRKGLICVNPTIYYPSIPSQLLLHRRQQQQNISSNPDDLDVMADYLSECLSGEVIHIGSLFGTRIGVPEVLSIHNASTVNMTVEEVSSNMILRLLDAGFAYVVSTGGKLLATLSICRSVLTLAPLPKKNLRKSSQTTTAELPSPQSAIIPKHFYPENIRKRLKDLPRIFRNIKSKGYDKFSVKINSNFDEALRRLREHHGDDCWVGPELEIVWVGATNTQSLETQEESSTMC